MKTWLLIACLASEFATAATPTFQQAFDKLKERSTNLQSQRAQVQKSESQLLANQAAFLPALTASAQEQQVTDPSYSRTQQGLLNGKLNLFHSGADVAGYRSGRAALEREQARLNQTELDEEQAHLTLLIGYVQSSLQMQVAKNIFHLSEELMTIQDARYKRGLVSLQETQKAMVEKSNSSAKLQDAEGRFEQSRAALATQLGEQDIEAGWPWKPFLGKSAVADLSKKEFDVKSLPSWHVAEQNVVAANQGMRAKFRDFLPSLDITVGYGYLDYLNDKTPGFQTTLLLTVPLFDLKQHADYRVQRQQESLTVIDKEKVRRNLLSDWMETKTKLNIALQSAQERERSRQLAQSLYEDNQRRLKAGRSSMNDVLVDQNRLAEAEILAINGWADAHLLYSRFCHALGRRVNFQQFGCL